MTCQHPYCALPQHSICANHCHWSLCSQHVNEHQTSLVDEFEQALQNLIKPTNELSNSLEQAKENIHEDQQKELDHLQHSHQTQLKILEQQSNDINRFQHQYNQISQQIDRIKKKEHLLTQEDFRHMESLLQEINQYQTSPAVPNLATSVPQQAELIHCPLTSLNIYGLLPSHNVRLCKSYKRIRHLFEHFRSYHHLTDTYANLLVDAVRNNLDPTATQLFPPDAPINEMPEKRLCVLHDTPADSGIRSTPCCDVVTDQFLPIHLKIAHRLRGPQIREILKTTKNEE